MSDDLEVDAVDEVGAPEFSEPSMSIVPVYPDADIFSQDHPDDPYRVLNVEPIANPGAKLLYQNATGFEKALADVDIERTIRIAAEVIKVNWNPWQVSERNLPFLAWAMGVTLWENWWEPEFQRWWVANQWYLKSIRGTRLGFDEFVKAVGGSTKRVITPPSTPFGLSAVGDIIQSINYLVPDAQYVLNEPANIPSTRAEYDGSDWLTWTDDRPKPTWDELVLASRAQYVARFPQLRIYPYFPRVTLPWLCFAAHKYKRTGERNYDIKNGGFLGPLRPLFPTNYNAGGKYTRTAKLYEPRTGEETLLTFRTITSVDMGPYGVRTWDQVTLPGHRSSIYHEAEPGKFLRPYPNAKRGVFLGRLHKTESRMVIIPRDGSLDLIQAKAQYQTTFPENKLIRLYPEHIAIKHPRRGTRIPVNEPECFSAGTPRRPEWLYRKFLPPSQAYKYMYERWYLFDPDRVPDVRKANVFMGNARFGIHKYTAEAHVKIRGRMPSFSLRTNGFMWGFTRPKNTEPVDRLRRGVRASMALRDKVLLNTKTTRVVQVRDLLDATGRYSVGQVIPN